MLETGIPNLDLILGGGVSDGDVLLVVGTAGAGKTTLTLQTAFHLARRGQNTLYVSTLSEPPTRLIDHIRSFTFFDERLVGKHVFLVSVYPLIRQGLERVLDQLVETAREHEARLVIIDGLMTLHDLYPEAPAVRTFVYELGAALGALQATVFITSAGGASEEEQHRFPEFTMADGIVELGRENVGDRTLRTVRVAKMRGLGNLLGQHTLRIDEHGLTVFPRLESVYRPKDVGLSTERVPWGLPELDRMMNGGPIERSTTVLAGAVGTGKTLTCLQYLLTGAERGERGLFVGFREAPRQLLDKARTFGLDLESPLREGRIEIIQRTPVDLNIDEATWWMQREIERCRPQRLSIDSLTDLEDMITVERRARWYMEALAGMLRNAGVTALVTREVPQAVGPELDFSNTPLAVLSENLVLLRYVEFRAELYSIVSILKMRDSPYDHTIRQYIITSRGLRVLSRAETAEGVLTGIARLPAEMRIKRGPLGPRREEGF